MEAIKVNSKYVTLKLTHEEAQQLKSMCNQANGNGDHEDWIKSAGGTKKELQALRSMYQKVMEITPNQ